MLKDAPVREVLGDLPRKWISDDYFDLILWYRDETITGFQLCYGKPYEERALTWFTGDRFSHTRVDSGDDKATSNRTPVLIPDGIFPKDKIIQEFNLRSDSLEPGIRSLVLEKIKEYREV